MSYKLFSNNSANDLNTVTVQPIINCYKKINLESEELRKNVEQTHKAIIRRKNVQAEELNLQIYLQMTAWQATEVLSFLFANKFALLFTLYQICKDDIEDFVNSKIMQLQKFAYNLKEIRKNFISIPNETLDENEQLKKTKLCQKGKLLLLIIESNVHSLCGNLEFFAQYEITKLHETALKSEPSMEFTKFFYYFGYYFKSLFNLIKNQFTMPTKKKEKKNECKEDVEKKIKEIKKMIEEIKGAKQDFEAIFNFAYYGEKMSEEISQQPDIVTDSV